MRMDRNKNRKVRIKYPSAINREGMEQWFAKKAAEGLLVIRTGNKSAVFLKGDACRKEYRLVPMDPGESKGPEEQAGVYREAGWRYVSNIRKMVLLLEREGAYPVDVYLSEAEEMCVLLQKKLSGQIRGNWISYLIYLFWFWFLCWMNKAGLLLLTVQGGMGILLAAMGLCGLIQLDSLKSIQKLYDLIGSMYPHREERSTGFMENKRSFFRGNSGEKIKWPQCVLSVLFLALALTGTGSLLASAVTYRAVKLEGQAAGTEADSLVPLSDIDGRKNLKYTEGLTFRGKEQVSEVISHWTPFTKRFIQVTQYGSTDENDVVSVMKLEYYEMHSSGPAWRLMGELQRYHMKNRAGIEKVESDFFDGLYVKEEGLPTLFACRGNQVMYVSYGGQGKLSDHIEAFEAGFRRLEEQ